MSGQEDIVHLLSYIHEELEVIRGLLESKAADEQTEDSIQRAIIKAVSDIGLCYAANSAVRSKLEGNDQCAS